MTKIQGSSIGEISRGSVVWTCYDIPSKVKAMLLRLPSLPRTKRGEAQGLVGRSRSWGHHISCWGVLLWPTFSVKRIAAGLAWTSEEEKVLQNIQPAV